MDPPPPLPPPSPPPALPQLPPLERPGKPGLLGTGIFVGCLAGGFAGISFSNDGELWGLWAALSLLCVIAGTVMVAMGVRSSKAAWSAIGALFGFLFLAGVGVFAGCVMLMAG